MFADTNLLQALASNLLGRAKDLANNDNLSSDIQFQLNLMLATKEMEHAQHLLGTPQSDGTLNLDEAIGLMNNIVEFISSVESDDDDPAWESKAAAVNQMQTQVHACDQPMPQVCLLMLVSTCDHG